MAQNEVAPPGGEQEVQQRHGIPAAGESEQRFSIRQAGEDG
jgi:hypothetical protein